MISYLILIFVLGLIAGSFANVCIVRIPFGKSIIKPRSYCPKCQKTIPWYHNIPIISFIILGCKCRFCKQKISWQYPIIELTTGLLFMLIGFVYYTDPIMLSVYLLVTLILIIISVTDLYHQIIPDRLSLMLVIIGLAFSPINHQLGFSWKMRLFSAASGGFISALGLFVIGYIGTKIMKKDAMGGGDIKLTAGIGTLLGLQNTILVILIASIIGSIAGILLIATKRLHKKEYIPFGPFLSLSAYAVIVCLPGNLIAKIFKICLTN